MEAGEPAHRELEASLAVVGQDAARTLEAVIALEELAGRHLGPPRERELRDVYLDLPGEPLLAAGGALRLRRAGARLLLAFKGDGRGGAGPGVEREEREAPWGPGAAGVLRRVAAEAGGDAAAPEAAITAAREGREALGALLGAGFHVLQDRRTRRITREIPGPAGGSGELAADAVRFEAGGLACVHREVEVEADRPGPDGSALVRACVDDLRGRFGAVLRPWERSKLATGLALEALLAEGERPSWLAADGSLAPEAYDRLEACLSRSP